VALSLSAFILKVSRAIRPHDRLPRHRHLAQARILRKCSAEVHAGAQLSVADVQSRCDEHVRKQAASALSVTLTVASYADQSGLAQALRAYGRAEPNSLEWLQAKALIDRATEAKAARQASARHDARCSALYVDLLDSGTQWHRPLDVSPEEAYRHVNEAANDYSGERDRLMTMPQPPTLAQRLPEVRAVEMHEANARRVPPVELPFTGWPGASRPAAPTTSRGRWSRVMTIIALALAVAAAFVVGLRYGASP